MSSFEVISLPGPMMVGSGDSGFAKLVPGSTFSASSRAFSGEYSPSWEAASEPELAELLLVEPELAESGACGPWTASWSLALGESSSPERTTATTTSTASATTRAINVQSSAGLRWKALREEDMSTFVYRELTGGLGLRAH